MTDDHSGKPKSESGSGMTNSLIHFDLKALSEPATKLIECASKAIGTWYKPRAIVREAKATAEAGLILAQGEIDKARLMRAAERMAFLEDRRQGVIESVVEQAMKELPETVGKEPVSEDWTVQFFENCKDVGDAEMQKLWAKILAGEVAKPGSYSRRTMNVLKTFEREDAEGFRDYCSVCFRDCDAGGHFALLGNATLNSLPEQYREIDLLAHLVTIGLVSAEHLVALSAMSAWKIEYFGKRFHFEAPLPPMAPQPEHVVSIASLTAVGEELARVVQASPPVGLIENLSEELWLLRVKIVEINA